MKQGNRGFVSYFIFIIVLLIVVGAVNMASRQSEMEDYTRAELIQDMEAGKVSAIELTPNRETPTGYLEIRLTNGTEKRLYVTDTSEAEELVRSYGFDPMIYDVPREG